MVRCDAGRTGETSSIQRRSCGGSSPRSQRKSSGTPAPFSPAKITFQSGLLRVGRDGCMLSTELSTPHVTAPKATDCRSATSAWTTKKYPQPRTFHFPVNQQKRWRNEIVIPAQRGTCVSSLSPEAQKRTQTLEDKTPDLHDFAEEHPGPVRMPFVCDSVSAHTIQN